MYNIKRADLDGELASLLSAFRLTKEGLQFGNSKNYGTLAIHREYLNIITLLGRGKSTPENWLILRFFLLLINNFDKFSNR